MKSKQGMDLLHHAKKIFLQEERDAGLPHSLRDRGVQFALQSLLRFFLRGRPKRKPYELKLDEIDKMTRSYGRTLVSASTGGEPFLRADLPKIIELYYKNCRLRNVGMPTNGSLTEKVVTGVEEILGALPGPPFRARYFARRHR